MKHNVSFSFFFFNATIIITLIYFKVNQKDQTHSFQGEIIVDTKWIILKNTLCLNTN